MQPVLVAVPGAVHINKKSRGYHSLLFLHLLSVRLEQTVGGYEYFHNCGKNLLDNCQVGNALLAIRDKRLYRQDFGTFEEYCQERWGMERRHAYRLMDAAQAVENVSLGTQILPTSERQARPLTKLEPELQPVAWQRAVETAPNGKVTAAQSTPPRGRA